MTTHSGRAGLRAVDNAVDRLIDQLMDQFREARAEHNIAAANMKAEFNAEIAELRRELLAHCDACVAQIKAVFETEVATLQRQLAEARAELSKVQIAKRERSETATLN
jgi:hypothetical protein